MFSETGIILGGYGIENGSEFGSLPSPEAKLASSRNSIELLHPGRSQELKNPIYVSWGHIPHNLGSWVSGGDAGAPVSFTTTLRPAFVSVSVAEPDSPDPFCGLIGIVSGALAIVIAAEASPARARNRD